MADDMSAEQLKPGAHEQQVAKRWLKSRGINPTEQPTAVEPPQGGFLDRLKGPFGGEKQVAPATPDQLVSEAYDLFVEKQDLKDNIVSKQRETMEPSPATTPSLSLEQKKELIRQGRVTALLPSTASPYTEVVRKSQTRIQEIDRRLDKAFSTPGMYDRFVQDLTRQVRIRHQTREVRTLDHLRERYNLDNLRIARGAEIAGTKLTDIEQKVLQDNQELRQELETRKRDLLKNPDVFDRVRVEELLEYRQQLHITHGRFVETPSRQQYLRELQKLWSHNKKVLITGATGTGKTELVHYATRQLFGPQYLGEQFEITGHRDMTPYELLGKTGLKLIRGEGGDVYRQSKIVQAMVYKDTAGDLTGAPFLYDEMDASPNEANIALKTILNYGPGDRIGVQMDTGETFVIGPNYSFTGTANVKSEKHTTRFEVDAAIVRVLEPMVVNYMPPWEVWDVCLASLMDRRGGINLSNEEAMVTLKNLCDATYWIQRAYRGEKVVTNPQSGEFLEARGQATTGKPASLKEAILDPGRVVGMLKGWEAARAGGEDLQTFFNQQIIRFINNENYPEEDRYYLTEIFALKGFLKGVKVSEIMIPGLDQATLDKWSGGSSRRRTAAGKANYLPWDKVARLDPYRRFKRPASKDAEDLLEDEEVVSEEELQTTETGGPMIERARNLLGKDFLGMEAIKAMENKFKGIGVNVEFIIDRLPAFPYSEEDLRIAKENGEMVVLRPEVMLMGGRQVDLTVVELRNLFQKDPQAKMAHPTYPYDWFDKETWATKPGEMKASWAIVKKEVLDGSTSKTWQDQETVLKQYEAGLKRKGAKNAAVRRRTALEATWDSMFYYTNTGERILPDKWDWIKTQTSFGYLVSVGDFDQRGLDVRNDDPRGSRVRLWVFVLPGSWCLFTWFLGSCAPAKRADANFQVHSVSQNQIKLSKSFRNLYAAA